METGFIAGYIDEDIQFCPYCGAVLDMIDLWSETKCRECDKSFFVIAGEAEED
jgi:NADH pyrophosphatase NudC (nudix superfamily)